MKVTLLASTPDATKLVAAAAWICQHPDFPTEADLHPDKCGPLVKRVVGYGHESILEHAVFTFAIEGISRTCSHQLVRYRHASFSQQSQRYVSYESAEYIVPQSIVDAGYEATYRRHIEDQAFAFYAELLNAGVPAEDARFVLPNATATKITVSMNARELRHFFAQRMCNKAQWELYNLANAIFDLCYMAEPVLFDGAGPDCDQCKEKEPCR